MPNSPLIVYLDSGDYSLLSDPRKRTEELTRLRTALLSFATAGDVQYVYSGAHLSEMAPSDGKHPSVAAARADLLVELCASNALLSFDRVVQLELASAAEGRSSRTEVSIRGDWFPQLDEFVSPLQWADIAREIDEEVKSRGLNREQRRKLKRHLFKSQRPNSVMREWLASQVGATDHTDILRMYPMRPEDARVLGSYVLGHASKADAEEAFLASLRDPRWMMRWFAAHHDRLTPVTEWLRGPSAKMLTSLREVAAQAARLRRFETTLGSAHRSELLTAVGWKAAQDALLTNVANRLNSHFHDPDQETLTAVEIDTYCPGLSTMVRSLHSSLWDAMQETPRDPMESDFADAVHSLYAPYVDLFRADRYMAPHVRKQVAGRGTTVVSRLGELPSAIEGALLRRTRDG